MITRILLLVYLLLVPTLGYAQVDGAGGGNATVGAVSELMAAALQTAGLYAQGSILVEFKDALTWLAALCYLAAITSAIFSVALFGTYRRALYLLIGPVCFYYVIDTTITVDGTALQVGERVIPGSVQDQLNFLQEHVSNEAYSQPAEVSRLFVIVDNLVSAVVQDIVALLINTRNRDDIVFQARERVFSWVLLSIPRDSAVLRLVSLGTMGECSRITALAMEIPNHRIDPTRPMDATSDLQSEQNLTERGQQMLQEYEEEKRRPRFQLTDDVIGLAYPDEDATHLRNYLFSCEETWDLVRRMVIRFAEGQLDINRFLGDAPRDPNVPWERVMRDVRDALNAGADSAGGQNAAQVLAVVVLRNILGQTDHAAMTSQLQGHMPFNAARRSFITEDVARADSYAGFLRIQYFASAIPYIQGLLLYLLTASFPFFAVFLVMPGRAESFLVWVSLWVWVKSWDIGFALVGVARRIMWVYMRHSVNQFQGQINWTQPESVFAVLRDNDPYATPNTYFQVIALLTVSIPFLTAHACLGATNLYDAFKMSIDQTANRFGQRHGAWMRRVVASRAEVEYRQAQAKYASDWVNKAWQLEGQALKDSKGAHGFLKTPDGRWVSGTGDGTKAEMTAIIAMTASAQFQLSEEGTMRAAKLASVTGRVTSQMAGAGALMKDAYTRGLVLGLHGHGNDFGTGSDGVNARGGGDYGPGLKNISNKEGGWFVLPGAGNAPASFGPTGSLQPRTDWD